jgi:hypothetical protein
MTTIEDERAGSQVETGPNGKGPHSPERVRGYRTVAAVYVAGVAGAGMLVARTRPGTVTPPAETRSQAWSDVALVGAATYKLSRLLTKQKVTSPLRAPFTEYAGPGGPGEVNVRPVGDGWRRSVGELVSCPFCLGVWIATAGSFGLHLAPRATRFLLATFAAVGVSDLLHFVHVDLEHRAEGGTS